MLKLLGALLLVLGGGLLGAGLTEPLRRRSAALSELLTGLTLLEQELELGGLPLCRMMELCASQCSGTAGAVFADCGDRLRQTDREEFPLLWEKIISTHSELGREGMQALLPLGNSLGRCPAEEQKKAVRAVRNRLEELRKRTEEQRPAQNRLCRALGLSGGAFAAILLL